jgi:equilibrative nucleoside transporter 1/2/3
VANGIYQNTIFGMAAKLPGKYTGAVVLGSNISGTFTAVVSLLTSTMTSNKKMAAIYYFITALFVLLVCFDTYFALPLNVSNTIFT